ncbi:phage tail tape measure protein [Sulfuricurvum sp.]|uniref:phage tail tape measure protein n=1 Tax=Sulfuricurvum sp. TaxID=2025608 RepID=UPI0026223347|nr:phage tail tape measure protein [Sulfuricurvum sp.]MDD2267007.1 phage tail tape measure protein [Sulfuricurvum sp.]MDD2782623.1 phage tail tape measure protein [Sulfuricurvum sp.]
MDKTLTLGILLTARDQFSPVFSSFKSSLSNITKGTKEFGIATSGIGTGLKGASVYTRGTTDDIIKSFVDLEDARTQLENTLMKSDGSISPFFKSINDEAVKLGDALPGTTADFYKMASQLKSLGVEEKSIVEGALKSAAYLGVVLKIPYEEAATETAKFKEALGIADDELLPFIDDIQRLSHMGVQVGEMSFAFSKIGATMKGLGLMGLKAARDVEPLVGMLIKAGFSGETVGTNLGNVIKDAVSYKGNKNLDAIGIKLNFTDTGGNFKGTANMMSELEKLKAIKSDSSRLGIVESIFGKGEASGMVNVLINNGTKGLAAFNKKLAEQADLNARVKNSSQTLGNMWEAFTGTASNLMALIGESLAPELKGMTEWFNNATSSLASFAKEYPGVAKFVGVAIVGFTVVTGVLGTLGIAIGAVATALSFLGITSMVTFGWVIGGVALIAGAAYLIISNWTPIKSFFSGMWGGIKSHFSIAWTVIKNLFSWTPIGIIISNWGVISPYFDSIFNGIKTVASIGFGIIKTLFAWTPLGIIINNWGAISSVFSMIVDNIKKPFVEFFGWIGEKFTWMMDKVGSVAGFFANNDSSMLPKKMDHFASTVMGVKPTPSHVPVRVAVRNPRVTEARMVTAKQTAQSNTFNTNISLPNAVIRSDQDIKKLAVEVDKLQRKSANDKNDRSYS